MTFVDVFGAALQPALRSQRMVSITAFDDTTPLPICIHRGCGWMTQNDHDLGANGQAELAGGSDEDDDRERKGYDDAATPGAAATRATLEVAIATAAMIESPSRRYKAVLYMSCSISTGGGDSHGRALLTR